MYKVAHQQIDGIIRDRETGYPPLKLEMHPIGTELPEDKQRRELHISIRGSHTVLGEDAIRELHTFLTVRP
jgi:hypothetical protein